jgi:hypothetical protein
MKEAGETWHSPGAKHLKYPIHFMADKNQKGETTKRDLPAGVLLGRACYTEHI